MLKEQLATRKDIFGLCDDIKKANSTVIKWIFVFEISQITALLIAVIVLLKD